MGETTTKMSGFSSHPRWDSSMLLKRMGTSSHALIRNWGHWRLIYLLHLLLILGLQYGKSHHVDFQRRLKATWCWTAIKKPDSYTPRQRNRRLNTSGASKPRWAAELQVSVTSHGATPVSCRMCTLLPKDFPALWLWPAQIQLLCMPDHPGAGLFTCLQDTPGRRVTAPCFCRVAPRLWKLGDAHRLGGYGQDLHVLILRGLAEC